jgi:transcription termination/antitermination protein NusG
MAKKWYVAHTYSGHENKAKKYLESAAEAEGLKDQIGQVLVPTEEIVEMRQGKRSTSVKKFLPSYILIEMELNKETQHLVTSTPGITNFVGASGKPVALREPEVKRILAQIDRSKNRDVLDIPYKIGEAVKVVDGPFSDFAGTVSEVNPEKRKLKVMVSIFGRPTPVELDYLQVKSL